MGGLDFKFPMRGLHEGEAFSDQPPETSRDLHNVRVKDPKTGRDRGAQRSGLSKFNSTRLNGNAPVRDLNQVTYDSKRLTYAALSPTVANVNWSTTTPSKSSALNIKVDRQGNTYVFDGRVGLVKYNSAGAEIWRITLPAQDELHVCRALTLESYDDQPNSAGAAGYIFAAVSSGGDQTKARIWKIAQGLDNKAYVENATQGAWMLEPGGFVEDMVASQGFLYTIQNFPDRWGAKLVVYNNIDSAVPSPAWEREIPYPANGTALKSLGDDSIFTCHEPFAQRGLDPRFPDFTAKSIDWTPKLLTDWDRRKWCWLDSSMIETGGVTFEEDEQILFWEDLTGNDRHLYKHVSYAAPTFNRIGIAGKPTVRFSGGSGATGGIEQALQSQGNSSTTSDYADNQKTLLPAYTGGTDAQKAQFVVFMVVRPIVDANIRWILGQPTAASTGTNDRQILVNRAAGATLAGSAAAGQVNVYELGVVGGDGAGGHVLGATMDATKVQCALITYICDGGRSTSDPKSLFRMNGSAIDRFDSLAHSTLLPTNLGVYNPIGSKIPGTGIETYRGDIAEILVLRDFAGATDGLIAHPYAPAGGGDLTGDDELQRIEGYLAHKWGISHLLPVGHPFSQLKGPPRAAGIAVEGKEHLLNSTGSILAKFGAAKGDLKWVLANHPVNGSFPAVSLGGVGYGVAVNSEGDVYSMGPMFDSTPASEKSKFLRKIIDQGSSYSVATVDGAWSKSQADLGAAALSDLDYKYPRMAVDTFDNVFLPYFETALAAPMPAISALVYTKTGTLLFSFAAVAGTNCPQGHAMAVDPLVPDYGTDLTNKRAEFFYLATNQGRATASDATKTVYRVPTVTVTSQAGSPRTLVRVGVAGGSIRTFLSSGTPAAPAGSGTLVQPELSATSQFISSTTAFGKVFYTDGLGYVSYDPKTDIAAVYKSTTAGVIPPRCKLITTWRGRIVLARGVDDPHNWHMSAKDNAFDWDTFPAVVTPSAAISGNNAQAGRDRDVINSLFAYSDDMLFFGGDHTLHIMRGDPQAGGQLDLISDQVGTSFGPAWCKSPGGMVFFFEPRGAVYAMPAGGGAPVSISDGIKRRLSEIDFSTNFVRLVWNDRDDGLHVLVCPYGAGGVHLKHWFWERKHAAWFEDAFGNEAVTNLQPTSAFVFDGDAADDRVLLFGCPDGYVREWDETAATDDGQVVYSGFLDGPLAPASVDSEVRFTDPEIVLADDQSGARWELYGSDTADSPGPPLLSGGLSAGRNMIGARIAANFVWLAVRNAQVNTRWAFESGSIRAYPAGRRRVRS